MYEIGSHYLRMDAQVLPGTQGQPDDILLNAQLFFIVINQLPQLLHDFLDFRYGSGTVDEPGEGQRMGPHVCNDQREQSRGFSST